MSKMFKKVSGAWVEQSTWSKIWKKTSGVWGVLYNKMVYLFQAGYVVAPYAFTTNYDIVQYTDYIQIIARGSGSSGEDDPQDGENAWGTISPITRGNFNYLCFDIQSPSTNQYITVGAKYDSNSIYGTWLAYVTAVPTAYATRTIVKVPISSIVGSFYPVVYVLSYAGRTSYCRANVYSVWFE
jgi:hypothetical protein